MCPDQIERSLVQINDLIAKYKADIQLFFQTSRDLYQEAGELEKIHGINNPNWPEDAAARSKAIVAKLTILRVRLDNSGKIVAHLRVERNKLLKRQLMQGLKNTLQFVETEFHGQPNKFAELDGFAHRGS